MIQEMIILIEQLSVLADDQRNQLSELSRQAVGGAAVRAEIIYEKIEQLFVLVGNMDNK